MVTKATVNWDEIARLAKQRATAIAGVRTTIAEFAMRPNELFESLGGVMRAAHALAESARDKPRKKRAYKRRAVVAEPDAKPKAAKKATKKAAKKPPVKAAKKAAKKTAKKEVRRVFSEQERRAILQKMHERMKAGEMRSVIERELDIASSVLYRWEEKYNMPAPETTRKAA